MNKKPIIGITLDWENKAYYSDQYPWYALRCNYAEAVSKYSATPLLLPYDKYAIDHYLEIIDGLIVTGGDYDLDPSVFGEAKNTGTRITKNNRTDFESLLLKKAVEKNMPILAICAGEQLLCAIYGGKLVHDIKTSFPKSLEHEQRNLNIPMKNTSHEVIIKPNTLLHKILAKEKILVNSSHHQAVKSVLEPIIISGIASDGIIEAIEMQNKKFVIGVEWHPEYLGTEDDQRLIEAFVNHTIKA